MGLRINQNISGMQGHYYLQLNESNFNRQIERLSSGLRINRAADDPAGLVISEKYRAQIEGLQQAINNANDGIGMIQTAEGALDEMTKLLRSMRNLALHAANLGPNDTTSIAADQAQITAEIETLNRIVDRTKFGTKSLLNGTMGVSGTPSNSNVSFVSGTTDTQSGTYEVNVTTAGKKAYAQTAVRKFFDHTATNGVNGATVDNAGGATLTFSGALFSSSYGLLIANGATVGAVASAINADATLQALNVTAAVVGDNVRIISDRLGNFSVQSSHATLKNASGINNAAADGTMVTVTDSNYSSKVLAEAETIQFKDVATGNVASITIAAGTSIASAITQMNTALSSNSIGVTASFVTAAGADQYKIRFTNTSYGDEAVVKTQIFHNAATSSKNLGFSLAASTWEYVANGASTSGMGGIDGTSVAGTINGMLASGSGLVLTSTEGNSKGLAVRIAGDTSGTLGNVVTTRGNLTFQVGAFQGQTVNTIINDLRASRLGLNASTSTASVNDLSVSTGTGAQEALAVIDAAISELASKRGDLGTFQKDVLEATVRNLGVAKQNMVAAESQIRDVDMAQAMLEFSKTQILQQTGIAMLTQANSSPGMIMSLFRG
jgi:flagellin